LESYATILESGKKNGVHTHIVVPPMVLSVHLSSSNAQGLTGGFSGNSRTFGNTSSKQIVELVKIAKSTSHLYSIPTSTSDSLPQTWAFCHVEDCAAADLLLLDQAMANSPDADGIYFTENGSFSWEELPKRILRGLGMDEEIRPSGEAEMRKMGDVLGVEFDIVKIQMAGR